MVAGGGKNTVVQPLFRQVSAWRLATHPFAGSSSLVLIQESGGHSITPQKREV